MAAYSVEIRCTTLASRKWHGPIVIELPIPCRINLRQTITGVSAISLTRRHQPKSTGLRDA